jgi:hypothetical protein
MKDPKSIYTEKLEVLIEVQNNLEELTSKLQRLAAATRHWESLLLPEETDDEHSPQDFGLPVLNSLDANDWITYEAFLAAFRLWKSAREAALTARAAIDASEEDVEELPETPWEREKRREHSQRLERRSKPMKRRRHRR